MCASTAGFWRKLPAFPNAFSRASQPRRSSCRPAHARPGKRSRARDLDLQRPSEECFDARGFRVHGSRPPWNCLFARIECDARDASAPSDFGLSHARPIIFRKCLAHPGPRIAHPCTCIRPMAIGRRSRNPQNVGRFLCCVLPFPTPSRADRTRRGEAGPARPLFRSASATRLSNCRRWYCAGRSAECPWSPAARSRSYRPTPERVIASRFSMISAISVRGRARSPDDQDHAVRTRANTFDG